MKYILSSIGFNTLLDVCICLYVISIFTFSIDVNGAEISKLFGIPVLVLSGIYLLSRWKKYRFDVYDICFLLFLILCIISILYAINQSFAIDKTLSLLQIFIMSVLIKFYVKEENKVNLLINSIAYSSLILGIYILYYYDGISGYLSLMAENIRIGSDIANVNAIGLLLSNGVIIFFWKAYYYGKKIYYLPILFCSIIAIGTGSKKVIIILLLSVILFYYFKEKGLKKIKNILYLIVGLTFLIYVMYHIPYFEVLFERIEKFLYLFSSTNSTDGSTETRYLMLKYGLEGFMQNPILGVGIGNARYIILDKLFVDVYTHNNYVEILVNNGILGALVYYSIFFYIILKLYKKTKEIDKISILLVVLLIIELIMQVGLVDYDSKVLYVLLICSYAYIEVK